MGENRISVFLQALILGAVVAIALRSPAGTTGARPIPAADDALGARLDALEREVARLESRFVPQVVAATPAAAPGVGERERGSAVTPVSRTTVGGLAALSHELALLRARVDGIAQASGDVPRRGSVADLRNQPPPNWNALREHVRRRDEDYERERQALLYLSSDEILARFGRPTSVFPGDVQGSRHWSYDQPDGEISASFQILDGCVIDL